jgi:short-subunit dehydrogenase
MGDQFIALMETKSPHSDHHRHFGLVVDDRSRVRDLVRAAGATLLEGNFLDFLDPWGNRVEVVEYRDIQFTKALGTIYLIHKVGRGMRAQGEGRILITGSIAGFMPGSYQAVYNGTKAFLDSFSYALREELKDTGVTVTCLMPGATETEFFRRADMLDTKVGTDKKDDPADVAKDGFKAMMSGEGGVVSGWQNKLEAAAAHVIPSERLAKKHSEMAAPGTAKK